eukprot:gene23239-277_t
MGSIISVFGPGGHLSGVGYYAYTRTPLGNWFFQRQLREAGRIPHTRADITKLEEISVEPIPYAHDNYGYLIVNTTTQEAVVVDPADAVTVVAAVRARQVTLVAILTTHRHADHSGGNAELIGEFPGIAVYGSRRDKTACVTHNIDPPKQPQRWQHIPPAPPPCPSPGTSRASVLADPASPTVAGATSVDKPGNTSAATNRIGSRGAARTGNNQRLPLEAQRGPDWRPPLPHCLFTGDSLFVAGCGRVFEGTHEEMHASLQKMASLDDATLIFPGHEYGLINLLFTYTVDKENTAVQTALREALGSRTRGRAFIPSSVGREKEINPFFRTHLAPLRKAGLGDDYFINNPRAAEDTSGLSAKVVAGLRSRKDLYKPTEEEFHAVCQELQWSAPSVV